MARQIQEALMPVGEDSDGVKLLKKMGWRPGQGVGPRITWRQRKIQDLLAAGKLINGINIDELDDDEEAKKHMYPQRDTPVIKLQRKNDRRGLGFIPEQGLRERLGEKRVEQTDPTLAGKPCLSCHPFSVKM
jgi:G patch domain-containing protein 1